MDNTPDNTLFNNRINVIPFTEMTELEAMFSLMDESYPKFLSLSLECFTSFFCAIIHSWCDDHHMDVRRVINMMQIAIYNEVDRENTERIGKEIF